MTRKMLGVMLGLGMFGAVLLAVDAACGGGPAIGIGFGGGGGSYGGVGYGGGYHGGSGVRFGVSVPLSNDGNVRLGVSNGGYYPSNYHNRYYNYQRGNYDYDGGYDNYRGSAYSTQQRGDRYVESAPEPPPVPTAGQVGRMSDDRLAGLVRAASEEYLQELDGYTNGETWEKYFKLAEIIEIAKKSKPDALDAAARANLAEVLKRMNSAALNAEYDTITKSWGFQTLQVGLREYALPLKVRSGHLLCANLQKISASLDGVSTGEGWKKHLQLDDLEKLAENAGAEDASRQKQFEKGLAKFDAVAQNTEYRVIAELDGFAASRTGLQRYLNALQADQPARTPPPPPPPALDTARDF